MTTKKPSARFASGIAKLTAQLLKINILFTVVFAILKLCGALDWPYWAVVAPLWTWPLQVVLVVLASVVVAFVWVGIDEIRKDAKAEQ
ncbi:hypothetical protein [Nocardia brasiliensis]|uniref:hypothetical protein n=1 Tax=Nocardia brasiliensis TaxID=37326 RepID=UPI0024582DFE|nr:hypothetical protein [Nocardia brasiliensis]